MAVLFSAVTVTANDQEVEFFVGGIPREYDDLEGWTAFDDFILTFTDLMITLKQEGMKTAYLTTDDWRLSAIKTYLKAGFVPDKESNPDFAERWKDVAAALNLKNQ